MHPLRVELKYKVRAKELRYNVQPRLVGGGVWGVREK